MPNTDFVHLCRPKRGRPPLLTESQIIDIVSSYNTHRARELAARYNCSHWNIKKIWARHGRKGKSRRKYAVDLNYFEHIDSPDKAYFLGLVAADGCVRRPKHGPMTLALKISSKDEELLVKFLSCLKSNLPISRSRYATPRKGVIKEASSINVISEEMCGALAKYNVVERKTRSYEPSPLPDKLMTHFLRGYFDGDGTVFKLGARHGDYPSHYCIAISVNEATGEFFQMYLRNQGIRSTMIEDKKSSLFQLRVVDNLSKRKFIELLYADSGDLFLKRKKAIIDQFVRCYNTAEEK